MRMRLLHHYPFLLTPIQIRRTNQTARSSFASSRPRKRASSTPRSVFGRAPSWPPSSMIREVCVCVQRSTFNASSVSLVSLSVLLSVSSHPSSPTRAHTIPITNIAVRALPVSSFFFFLPGRAMGMPSSVHLTCVYVLNA